MSRVEALKEQIDDLKGVEDFLALAWNIAERTPLLLTAFREHLERARGILAVVQADAQIALENAPEIEEVEP